MMSSQDSTSLLESLKQLYSRVMGLHAEARARSNLNRRNTAASQNIVLPLSDCIDKLAANVVKHPVDAPNSQTHETGNHSHDHASIGRSPSKTELGELSVHLKDSHRYSGASQDTGDRLMQSTWEHFHTSIRLARQGDVDAARLHSELTNTALNEAAHYLPEPVYSRFSQDVMKALDDIKGQI